MADKPEAKKPGTPTLNTKLAEVAAAVSRIPKRGHNDFHNYDYATEADVLEAVRDALSSRSVTLQPAILEESIRQVNTKHGTTTVTCLRLEMQWRDGESGETLHIPWMGWGVDPQDKGGYKALTGAEKYFLMKTFLIPTGDDPERSAADDGDHAPRATAAGPPPPDGSVCVTAVQVTKTKTGTDRFVVHFSDGEKLSTLDDRVGNLATQVQGTGEAVTYTTEQRGKWTNLKTLERAQVTSAAKAELAAVADQIEDEPPLLTEDDIPF